MLLTCCSHGQVTNTITAHTSGKCYEHLRETTHKACEPKQDTKMLLQDWSKVRSKTTGTHNTRAFNHRQEFSHSRKESWYLIFRGATYTHRSNCHQQMEQMIITSADHRVTEADIQNGHLSKCLCSLYPRRANSYFRGTMAFEIQLWKVLAISSIMVTIFSRKAISQITCIWESR